MSEVLIFIFVVIVIIYGRFFRKEPPIYVEWEQITGKEAEEIYQKILTGEIEVEIDEDQMQRLRERNHGQMLN